MKGVVFTEFTEMVEEKFSLEMVDHLIEATSPPSGGSYTSVGTYDHRELVAMLVELSQQSGHQIPELLNLFGHHLFAKFVRGFPMFFDNTRSAFELLGQVDGHIHVEVRKLYPDAELPRFSTRRVDENTLEMLYHSSRHLEDLAQGLIEACALYYGESIDITRAPEGDGVLFTLKKRNQ